MSQIIRKRTLENGLEVYFYNDPNKHTVRASLIAKFGGIDRDFILDGVRYSVTSGMAHFIEHLLIEHNSYGNLIHVFGEMQMQCNGGTYSNQTRYYFDGVENIEKALEILIKAIGIPTFTEENIEKTKAAIYEEIRMCNDDVSHKIFDLQCQNIFKETPYVNNIGTLNDIENLTFEEVKKVYDAFYRPQNELLIIAGNFDEEKMFALIKTIYKEIESPTGKLEKFNYHESKEVKNPYFVHKMPTGEDIVRISYKLDCSKYTPTEQLRLDFYLSHFIRMNFGITSNTYKELIERKVITDTMSLENNYFKPYALVSISAYTGKEKAFTEKILEVIQNPIYDEKLFKLFQREDKLVLSIRPENIGGVVEPFLDNLITFDYPDIDTIENINEQSFEDFKKNMQELSFDNFTIIKIEKES